MALLEVCQPPTRFGRCRSPYFSPCIGIQHSPSKYFCQWVPLSRDFKITYLSIRNCLLGSRIMAIKKGESIRASRSNFRKVLWYVEADVSEGEILYITGDLEILGCWEPEKAIPLSPCEERTNLWMAETEVPDGVHFKYNYFMKHGTEALYDIIWRLGPEFSLSIPLTRQPNEKFMVRDLWVNSKIEIPPVFSWGTWLEIIGGPELINHRRQQPFSPAGLEESQFDSNDVLGNIPERRQPVEEPWLPEATTSGIEFSYSSHLSNETEVSELEFPKKEGDEHSYKSALMVKPISTIILINSSVCTMQRVAILEDGKLVELLLEPVKHNVQCDSVYLGVVTKLVPHMGGAFVDIGISRPSLMEIKQSRAPFVCPAFHELVNGKEVNGFVSNEVIETLDVQEHYNTYSAGTMNDRFVDVDEVLDDHEQIYNINSSSSHRSSPNGTVNYADGEIDFVDYDEENEHSGEYGSVEDVLSVEMEGSNASDLSDIFLQSLKENSEPHTDENKWDHVKKGTKVIVQVVKEGLGTKGPALTAYPTLRSRFWILSARCNRIGVSKKITGVERTRLRVIAKTLQPPGFGLTVRTVAASHSLEELQKDLEGLLSTWRGIIEHAKSAALAADEGVEGAVPVLLHRAMSQTLSVVQDYFNEKVNSMVVDSPRTYREVTSYLQEIAPDLCDRVVLYTKRTPIFDEYGVEEEIDTILSKRVPLVNGGSLVIEQTEALVSIDVNGGHSMLGQGTSQEKAVLDVNLAAAKQIARELRLRDIGGIIVADFIDMVDESNKRLVYEEMKKAVERDRSIVKISELSRHGLMEITRKRVRPSVTFMISEPCPCCQATGRVEALETSYSKIEHEICRRLASSNQKAEPENAKSWQRFVLRVDRYMFNYLTSGKRTKLAVLSSSLKVWILLKVARGFTRGTFEVRAFTEDMAAEEQQRATIPRLRASSEGKPPAPASTKLTIFPVKKWKARGK